MSKRFVAILMICVAVFVGLFVFTAKDSTDEPGSGSGTTTNHTQGSADAKVTLVEYADFQCPACSGYFPILQEIKTKYGERINFQFRHFPIVSIHPNAMSAHRAAEAAGKQDKFWEMHDMLYERQTAWSGSSNASPIFEGYANELGLNMDQYKKDVVDPATKASIDADFKAGEDLGVDGTPGFILNGKKLDNAPRDVEGFSALIDEILNGQSQ